MCESESGVSRGATDHETQQVQDRKTATRTELAMGHGPPSRTACAMSCYASPGVEAGEVSTRNPRGEVSNWSRGDQFCCEESWVSVLELVERVSASDQSAD